ncbi:formyl peptide receptor-related sequence 4-like [Discoglossus pictus]
METYDLSEYSNSTIGFDLPEEDYEGISILDMFHFLKMTIITCFSITFVLGIVGNGLVIWIAGFKMKKSVNTIWFLNLGVADFTFNVFLPLHIIEVAMDGHWPFGQIMCKAVFTVLFLNMSASTSFLMLISIDRCSSVLCPVWSKNHRNCRLANIISAVIWLLCLILTSPYLVFYDTNDDYEENTSSCNQMYVSWDNITIFDHQTWKQRHNAMVMTRFLTMFLIPFSIILLCYGLIAFKLKKRRNISAPGRTFKVIITVILCFFFCWFPFQFWPMLDIMNIETDWALDFFVINIACCLAFFNSCLNPILYVFIGRDFKASLLKSIPFLMEKTFRERCDFDSQNVVETELVTVHS